MSQPLKNDAEHAEDVPYSIEAQAEIQRVEPVQDLNEISALWPTDDDPDALDAFVTRQRQERRKLASQDG